VGHSGTAVGGVGLSVRQLEERIDEVTVDAYGDDDRLRRKISTVAQSSVRFGRGDPDEARLI
jgi:hypothetical protein